LKRGRHDPPQRSACRQAVAQQPPARYRSPLLKDASYVEEVPVPEYRYASEAAYERFNDLKYGIRIHWDLYSLQQPTRRGRCMAFWTRSQGGQLHDLHRSISKFLKHSKVLRIDLAKGPGY
jgi:alpha-L-fucosidase